MGTKQTDQTTFVGAGTAFHAWRKRLGLTQKEASEKLGVTVPTFQSYEREQKLRSGEHQAPPKMALLAAAAIESGMEPLQYSPESKPSSPKKD